MQRSQEELRTDLQVRNEGALVQLHSTNITGGGMVARGGWVMDAAPPKDDHEDRYMSLDHPQTMTRRCLSAGWASKTGRSVGSSAGQADECRVRQTSETFPQVFSTALLYLLASFSPSATHPTSNHRLDDEKE
nr:hypothetical protein CFP56_31555 [Quercus suber]